MKDTVIGYVFDENEYAIIELLSGGKYSITITDKNGCRFEIKDLILPNGTEDCLFIPNAFTPNGDGINDIWEIENIMMYPEYEIQVFNRWGQMLFNATYGQDFWDGTQNGKPLPTGPYIYVIKLDPNSEAFIGIVTLIR